MKKCLTTLLAMLSLGAVAAGLTGYAGRKTVTYTTTTTITPPNTTPGVRLSGLSVKFIESTNVTFYVSATRGVLTNLAYRVDVVSNSVIFIASSGLWFEPNDKLILSNSIPISTTVQADFTYD